MFFVTSIVRMTVHAPRGIPFQITTGDAVKSVQKKYHKPFFGVSMEYLQLGPPSAEFLPFYFCEGSIKGTFRGVVSYRDAEGGAKNNAGISGNSGMRQVVTAPQPLQSSFGPHQTQIYAGYKYNLHYVQGVLCSETNPLQLRNMSSVNVEGATINLFEQSTRTLRVFVEQEVRRQATETACAMISSYHPSASNIVVEFIELNIHIDDVIPVFMPCYVVKACYDQQEYTLYVNGASGQVTGPFLINSLYAGRTAAVATALVTLCLAPNKGAGFIMGSLFAVPMYYIAFYAARYFPLLRRDYSRKRRQKLREKHESDDRSGFRPDMSSKRIDEEYSRSSYWDTHAYEQKWSRKQGTVRDPRGYYGALGLNGGESVNEIRSAYRKIVLTEHPDTGGSTERMTKVNEAYRVLRDPKKREEYDRSGCYT
ncbi:chaperone protein DNAj, putative [Trypanosoma equiperdum]|uniref:Chaperone protein DNAJ, putative n=2 Tax=Trypanozoon TaxID=39700 RepID=Q385J7_TRYB2|nr:chaperone protein DnaJ [Trypanosoma brucei brucei TREU927]EAN79534.1 chaperone protein DNAJ, putative [Trypanosoma brucei brucei TREU927]SCU66340.1 chaperone protein DNAj, putative [Trypanosoma equiperdum]